MPELITPTTRLRPSFVSAMDEFAAEGRGDASDSSTVGSELRSRSWASVTGFATYVRDVLRACDEADTARPAGTVPQTTLWWADCDTFIGRISIRHRLTPHLLEFGGHIGYDVRASRRRQGHATSMLAAALPVAERLGIDPVLITCDHDNLGSRLVIERNGGVLEDVRGVKRRYWVPTDG